MGYVSSRITIRGFTLLAIVILMSSYISTYAFAGSGVSTFSTGTSSTSQHSTVSSISNGYDGNQETYTQLEASGELVFDSTCSYNSFAEVTYTLSLNSSGNQTISMFAFSQTVHSMQTGSFVKEPRGVCPFQILMPFCIFWAFQSTKLKL